jgi:hypothetical protein
VPAAIGDLDEKVFMNHIKQLLHNPTSEPGRGSYTHTQWGGLVKIPSQPRAFIVHNHGNPVGPEDYQIGDHLGATARPRKAEPYYTQLRYGLRASDSMIDPLDEPDDQEETWTKIHVGGMGNERWTGSAV